MVKLFPEDIDYYHCVAFDIKGNKKPLLIIRGCGIVGMTIILALEFTLYDPAYRLTQFSYWGAVLSYLAMISMFISLLLPNENGEQYCIYKIAFVLYETAWTAQGVITLFYWGVLVWANYKLMHTNLHLVLLAAHAHSFAQLILIADFILNRIQFHIPHIVFPILSAILYMIESVLLSYLMNFTPYPMLTWKDVLSIIVAIGLLGLFVGSFFIGYGICKLKRKHDNTTQSSLLANKSTAE